MAIDVNSIISQLTKAAQNDDSIVDKLDANPIALIEKMMGIDLPDEMLAPILAGFEANLGQASGAVSAADSSTGAPVDIMGIANSVLSSEGLDVDGDGDVDLDDLKAGIMGSLL